MILTSEEKAIAAQLFFERCFPDHGTYNICPINSLYQLLNGGGNNIYQDEQDEVLKNYKMLQLFNGLQFSNFPQETKQKVIKATKDIFEELGYKVSDEKIK